MKNCGAQELLGSDTLLLLIVKHQGEDTRRQLSVVDVRVAAAQEDVLGSQGALLVEAHSGRRRR